MLSIIVSARTVTGHGEGYVFLQNRILFFDENSDKTNCTFVIYTLDQENASSTTCNVQDRFSHWNNKCLISRDMDNIFQEGFRSIPNQNEYCWLPLVCGYLWAACCPVPPCGGRSSGHHASGSCPAHGPAGFGVLAKVHRTQRCSHRGGRWWHFITATRLNLPGSYKI